MGYGGSDGQARRIGGSGDGGVDSVIDPVGREGSQAVVRVLHGHNVAHGMFLTTSRFSPSAIEYACLIGTRVVIIDGARLSDLVIAYGIGMPTRDTYRIIEVDEDYFE